MCRLHFRFLVISSEPFYKFSIPIKSEEYDTETESGLTCNLTFTYTAKYPEETPVIEIENSVNVDQNHEVELLHHLEEQVLKSH